MLLIWFARPPARSWPGRILRAALRRGPTHVMVGDNEATIDASFGVGRFWPRLAMRSYPGLVAAFQLNGGMDWDANPAPDGYPFWGVAARWVTRGRWPRRVDDCLGIALRAIRREGHTVPRTVLTPKALMEWCLAHATRVAVGPARTRPARARPRARNQARPDPAARSRPARN